MRICIVTGGRICEEFLLMRIAEQKYDLMIAVDHGVDFFADKSFKPDYVVGDMDSARLVSKQDIASWENCSFYKYPAEKDETDTELAILLALEKKATEIHIYGATGTRMDHILGNIHIMKKALMAGVSCYLLDEYNRIRLVRGSLQLRKEEQYGQYVSFLPWEGEILGVSLKGFKYPLDKAMLEYGRALGVSNEILNDVAEITIESGIVVMIEARD